MTENGIISTNTLNFHKKNIKEDNMKKNWRKRGKGDMLHENTEQNYSWIYTWKQKASKEWWEVEASMENPSAKDVECDEILGI